MKENRYNISNQRRMVYIRGLCSVMMLWKYQLKMGRIVRSTVLTGFCFTKCYSPDWSLQLITLSAWFAFLLWNLFHSCWDSWFAFSYTEINTICLTKVELGNFLSMQTISNTQDWMVKWLRSVMCVFIARCFTQNWRKCSLN